MRDSPHERGLNPKNLLHMLQECQMRVLKYQEYNSDVVAILGLGLVLKLLTHAGLISEEMQVRISVRAKRWFEKICYPLHVVQGNSMFVIAAKIDTVPAGS